MIKKLETLLSKIKILKQELVDLGEMRPGSVTKQLHKRDGKEWPYWQISYTQKGRSRTEYIRDELVSQIKTEVEEYKKFKTITNKLVELSIDLSKERIKICKENMKT